MVKKTLRWRNNEKSNIRYTIIILLVIITLLLIKFLPNLLNKSNYSNLEIYKNNTFINVSEEQRRKIIDYLKKEKFNKKTSQVVWMEERIKYLMIMLNYTLMMMDLVIIRIITPKKTITPFYLMNLLTMLKIYLIRS